MYLWYSEGPCNLTLEMQPIPGPTAEVEDMSWCVLCASVSECESERECDCECEREVSV